MSELCFKVLGPNGVCCHGGSGRWLVQGEWMPMVHGNLAPCTRGYHLCRAHDLVEWLGPVIWIAEGRGKAFTSPQYLIYPEARVIRSLPAWTGQVARLFAAECAERVLSILETRFPEEHHPRQAIQVARDLADGSLSFEEANDIGAISWSVSRRMDGALRDVAIAAYGAAVWKQDGLAAWAAAASARTAAAAYARDGAMAFAREHDLHPREAERKADQAGAEAFQAERAWQTTRLFEVLGPLE